MALHQRQLPRSILSLLIAGMTINDAAAQITYRTVAEPGDQVPGHPAGTTVGVGLGTINDLGDLAWEGWIDLPDGSEESALWVERSGIVELVVKGGDSLPGQPPDSSFGFAFRPKINNQGQIAYMSDFSVPEGIWSGPPSAMQAVLLQGDQFPGAAPGVKVSSMSYKNIPDMGNGGHVTTFAKVWGDGIEVNQNTLVWRYGDGQLEIIAWEGSPAPDTPEGVVFDDLDNTTPTVNGHGNIAFRASVTGLEVTSENSLGIWSDVSGGLRKIVRAGDSAPGFPEGVAFQRISYPFINDAGQVLFSAWLTGAGGDPDPSDSIWIASDGAMTLVAISGDAEDASTHGILVGNIDYHVVNKVGWVCFSTRSGSTAGVWLRDDQSLHVVAYRGMRAPGTPEGVTFGWFGSLSQLSINAGGQIAFEAGLVGPGIDSTNKHGVWATDLDGNLHLIVRRGVAIETDRRVTGTVAYYDVNLYSGGEDGYANSFNDRGEVAFWATFRGPEMPRSGVYVASTIPDTDGDGIPDSDDACPEEDATDLDANGDGCLDQAVGLTGLIQDEMDLPLGIENALIHTAKNAAASQDSGKLQAAANQLQAMVKFIQAQQGKAIPEQDAQMLLEFIENAASQL